MHVWVGLFPELQHPALVLWYRKSTDPGKCSTSSDTEKVDGAGYAFWPFSIVALWHYGIMAWLSNITDNSLDLKATTHHSRRCKKHATDMDNMDASIFSSQKERKQKLTPDLSQILVIFLTDLLNITAAPNNGTRGSLYSMLKNPPSLAPLQRGEQRCKQRAELSASDLHNHCSCSAAHNPVSHCWTSLVFTVCG